MLEILISPAARRDIVTILAWSEENFGPFAMKRYQRLLATAIKELADDPFRVGSVDRAEINFGYRTYHLSHSRNSSAKGNTKVKQPRHFVLYRIRGSQLEIGRILHDSMEIEQRIAGEPSD